MACQFVNWTYLPCFSFNASHFVSVESLFPRYNSPFIDLAYLEQMASIRENFGFLDLGHIISKRELVPNLRQYFSELVVNSPEMVDHLMRGYELMQQFM